MANRFASRHQRSADAAPPGPAEEFAVSAPTEATGALPVVDPAPPNPPAPLLDDRPPATPGGAVSHPIEVPHTRASAAWAGVAIGLAVLVVILVFIIQNLSDASVHFLGFRFSLPIGLLILAAAVGGGIIVLLVGLARLAQLRMMARRHRKGQATT